MKILTKYILKEFLKPLFFIIIILVGISIIVDFFRELNLFLDKKATANSVLKYLIFINIHKSFLILPVAVLLAVLFSLSSMEHSGEFVAIKTAGINLRKLLMPVFLGGFLLSISVLFMNSYLTPPIVKKGYEVKHNEILKLPHSPSKQRWRFSVMLSDNYERHLHIGFLDLDSKTMQDISLYNYGAGSRITEHILAKKALWDGSSWKFFDGIKRRYTTDKSGDTVFEERFSSMDAGITIPPENFVFDIPRAEEMSFDEHKRLIDNLNKMGITSRREVIQLLYRISSAFSNFIVIFIGVYFATAVSPRQSKIFSFTAALCLAFAYYGINAIGQSLGEVGIFPPVIAAWFGNIIYAIVGVFLYRKIPT